jgi:hypothetical protein
MSTLCHPYYRPLFPHCSSLQALDLWLIVLQVVTLTVTLFIDIQAVHAQPLYFAYQLQVVTLYALLSVIYFLGGWQHRKDLGKLLYKLLDRATCRIMLGREGCLYLFYSLICPGRASSSDHAIPESYRLPDDVSHGSLHGTSKETSTLSLGALMGPRLTSAEADQQAYFRHFREEDEEEEEKRAAAEKAATHSNTSHNMAIVATTGLNRPASDLVGGEDSGSGTDDEARARARSRSRAASAGPPPPPPRPISYSGGRSRTNSAAAKGSRSNTAFSEDSLMALLEHDHTGPYAVYAFWCLMIAVFMFVKAALFAYTPITEGGAIGGVASKIVWPWLFYILPEGAPPLIFLHLLLRGGLFSCRGWKCQPQGCCKKRSKAGKGAVISPSSQSSLAVATAANTSSNYQSFGSVSNGNGGTGGKSASAGSVNSGRPVPNRAVSFTTAAPGLAATSSQQSSTAPLTAIPGSNRPSLMSTLPGTAQPLLVQINGQSMLIMGGAAPGTAAVLEGPAAAAVAITSVAAGSSSSSARPSLQPPL